VTEIWEEKLKISVCRSWSDLEMF